jgi:hypothetical protein
MLNVSRKDSLKAVKNSFDIILCTYCLSGASRTQHRRTGAGVLAVLQACQILTFVGYGLQENGKWQHSRSFQFPIITVISYFTKKWPLDLSLKTARRVPFFVCESCAGQERFWPILQTEPPNSHPTRKIESQYYHRLFSGIVTKPRLTQD